MLTEDLVSSCIAHIDGRLISFYFLLIPLFCVLSVAVLLEHSATLLGGGRPSGALHGCLILQLLICLPQLVAHLARLKLFLVHALQVLHTLCKALPQQQRCTYRLFFLLDVLQHLAPILCHTPLKSINQNKTTSQL